MFITECPRDAMQGLHDFIPTDLKVKYLNSLLKVGFDRLDFGSFVSPKAIPQMRDTAEVLEKLEEGSKTELLAIIANTRGAEEAAKHARVRILGFPFSISETFQLRNTNKTREQALDAVKEILDLANHSGKEVLVYLSMGFGNPYGDEWNERIVSDYAARLFHLGVRKFALADTIGSSEPAQIELLFPILKNTVPQAEWGLHLHSRPDQALDKIRAALKAGCERIDTAIRGFGGCPMAKDDLTGNTATEAVLATLEEAGIDSDLNLDAFEEARQLSHQVFVL